MHVESEVVDLMEGLVTDGTLELLLSAVRQFVVFVVSYQRKWLNNVNMTYIKATKLFENSSFSTRSTGHN